MRDTAGNEGMPRCGNCGAYYVGMHDCSHGRFSLGLHPLGVIFVRVPDPGSDARPVQHYEATEQAEVASPAEVTASPGRGVCDECGGQIGCLDCLRSERRLPDDAEKALAECGIAGIMDEFRDPADAIRQMASYIREAEAVAHAATPEIVGASLADRILTIVNLTRLDGRIVAACAALTPDAARLLVGP